MNKIITNHNKRILNDKQEKENTACNCRKTTLCPVNNKCQTKNVVYKATLNNGVNYIGMTSTTFKTRYNNHIHSFKTEAKKNSTTLSQYIWRHNLQPTPNIKWEILQECAEYQTGQLCSLCLAEKTFILKETNNPKNINSRTDFTSRCIHQKSKTLSNT